MKFHQTRYFSGSALHHGKYFRVRSRNQNVVFAVLLRQHRAHDGRDLIRSLSFTEKHLGKSLAQRAVMVHFRKVEVFKWKMLQPLNRLFRRELPRPHGFQKFQKFLRIHRTCRQRSLTPQPPRAAA